MQTKVLFTGAVLALGLASPAIAASCAPRETVVDRLAERYGESRQSVGLGSNNSVVEVFASEETGTWTIVVTSVSGLTCLMASGQAYEPIAEVLPIEGNDA
ncbi:MAG: hypothetical protein AAF066_14835 [Pseudomonadota bacterium]|mgnify:CR=1 FL=1